jgi:hypothetical protein
MPCTPLYVFGFKRPLKEINRWAARYRAAASFESVTLADYQSPQTVKGYSALIRATLVWSAFERYLPIVGLDQESCADLLKDHDPAALSAAVLNDDKDGRLFKYVRQRVTNPKLGRHLDAYLKGDPFNVSYLLSGLRHIFGHGHLTPGSNDAEPLNTVSICNRLSDFHLNVMDADFSKRVEEFEGMMSGR